MSQSCLGCFRAAFQRGKGNVYTISFCFFCFVLFFVLCWRMWVAWYQTLAILWAWKKEEFLLGCCSSPSLFLKEVSEALPWSAFGQVDHQVLPWNCVSCYNLKDLKVFICSVCSLLKGKSRSVPLAAPDRMCCEQWRCLRWCWEQPNKGCGTGIQVPNKSVTGIDCTGVSSVCRAEPWGIELGIKETKPCPV